MSERPESAPQADGFRIERHGELAVLVPPSEVDTIPESLVADTAELMLAPLRQLPPSGLIVDLSGLNYAPSLFLSFLLRCHMILSRRGSEMVIAGPNTRVREELRVTNLDTLWAIYGSRAEAIAALDSD